MDETDLSYAALSQFCDHDPDKPSRLENWNKESVVLSLIYDRGGMAEWLKAAVLKTVRGATPSWVRILLPPPRLLESIF